MLTYDQAEKIASNYVDDRQMSSGIELSLMLDKTRVIEGGWVFFYQSTKYIETKEIRHMLTGNAPIIIDSLEGEIHETGTAMKLEHYIDDFVARSISREKVTV